MSDDSEGLLQTEDVDVEDPAIERRKTVTSWPAYTFFNVLLLCMSAAFLLKAISVRPDDATCTRQLSTYCESIP